MRAMDKATPAISNFTSISAMVNRPNNSNSSTLGLARLAEPDVTSKGFVLLFVFNLFLIYFIKWL